MDINQIINTNIGIPLFISIAGSRIYGTNTETSDHDYFSLVKSNNEISNDAQSHDIINDYDIFYLPYQSIEKIQCCSNPLFIGDLVNIIYINKSLKKFIDINKNSLMNIAPRYTYNLTLELIDHDFQYNNHNRILILGDILRRFYYTGDFSQCFPVSEYCKNQIKDLRKGKTYTDQQIKDEISFIHSNTFKDYFNSFSVNNELHQEFYSLICDSVKDGE